MTSAKDWKARLNAASAAQARYLWVLLVLGVFYLAIDARLSSIAATPDIETPILKIPISTGVVWESSPTVLFFLILVLAGTHRVYMRAETVLKTLGVVHSESVDRFPNAIDFAVYTSPTSPRGAQRALRFAYQLYVSLFAVEAGYLLWRVWWSRTSLPASWLFLALGATTGLVAIIFLAQSWIARWRMPPGGPVNTGSDPEPDFRLRRALLPREAFAYAPGPQSRPTDLIPSDTWSSIMALPDDVSIRTTDRFGSIVKDLWWCWHQWTTLVLALGAAGEKAESPIARVAMNSTDYLQASVFNLVTGFYRLAFTSLRAVLEGMTIGLHLQSSGDRSEFEDWAQGGEIRFGRAADKCMTHIARLEAALQTSVGDDLFRQGTKDKEGGLARRLFGTLSHYAHGRLTFTDADIWASNGPVFVSGAVTTWRDLFLCTYAVALLEARLAEPALKHLGPSSKVTAEELFHVVVGAIPDEMDAKGLLEAVPADVWHSKYV